MKHVVVVGGTGLIGSHALHLLAQKQNIDALSLVRTARTPGPVKERVFDFQRDAALIGSSQMPCEALLCVVGTTLRKAGSKKAFRAVDFDLPLRLAKSLSENNPGAIFATVTSVGADSKNGFYLQTKFELEAELKKLDLHVIIARPSLLLGERSEFRFGEWLSVKTVPPIFALLGLAGLHRNPIIAKYRPILAQQVAAAILEALIKAKPGKAVDVLEGLELQKNGT